MNDKLNNVRLLDGAAAFYDQAHPDYLQCLFGDVMQVTGLHAGDRLLEIGYGTEKATIPLLIRLSAQVVNQRFGDWDGEKQSFDVVVSANLFYSERVH